MSLVCARARRAMRQIFQPNTGVHLKVVIKSDGVHHYVEIDVVDERKDSMGRWTFYKKARDVPTEQIIGETFVEIDLHHHSFTDRQSQLTNVQSFHVFKTAASFLDHMQSIFPNMSMELVLEKFYSLEMEDRTSFNNLFTRAHTIKFKKCEIPKKQLTTLRDLYRQHQRIVFRDCDFQFSSSICVKKIEFREFGLETHVAKNFHLFKCQEFEFNGDFSKEDVVRMIRSWKTGKNPQLKMMKLGYVPETKKILTTLKAKQWKEPGPRIFKLGDFEYDCAGGHDVIGQKNVLGTLNFTEHPKLIFVVWN